MAIYGTSFVVTYVAWDTSANAGKTGDVANHTLRWVKDGTAAAPTNAASEIDAVNAPGLYKVTMTAAEAQAVFGTLAGKSSTASISLMPVSVAFEQFPANFPSLSISAAGLVDLLQSAADKVWATTTRALTDKVGFALSAAGVQAIWDALTSALTTVGSIGKLLVTNLDAAISSRFAAASYTAPDNTSIAAIKLQTDQLGFTSGNVNARVATVAVDAIDAGAVAASAWNELLDLADAIEVGVTPRQAFRAMAAVLAGNASGLDAASATALFKAIGNAATTRISAAKDGTARTNTLTL